LAFDAHLSMWRLLAVWRERAMDLALTVYVRFRSWFLALPDWIPGPLNFGTRNCAVDVPGPFPPTAPSVRQPFFQMEYPICGAMLAVAPLFARCEDQHASNLLYDYWKDPQPSRTHPWSFRKPDAPKLTITMLVLYMRGDGSYTPIPDLLLNAVLDSGTLKVYGLYNEDRDASANWLVWAADDAHYSSILCSGFGRRGCPRLRAALTRALTHQGTE